MIKRVEISNIYGIAEPLTFEPNLVTIVKGANGSGKSSIQRGIASCFEGGVVPERLRIGAEKGHVRLTLEDDSKVEFRAWIKNKRDGTKEAAQAVEFITKEGVTLPGGPTLVKQLGDALAVDPARLLAHDVTTAAGRKSLTQAILEVMPFTVSAADLGGVLRKVVDSDELQPYELEAKAKAGSVLPNPVDLGGLRKSRMALEETRRRVGVDAKQAAAAIEELRKGIASEEVPGETQRNLDAAESKLAALRADKKARQDEVTEAVREAEREAEAVYRARLGEINKNKQAHMDAIAAEFDPQDRDLSAEVVGLKAKVADVQRAEGARKQVAILEDKAAAGEREYEVFSRAIEMLDEVKAAKLADSPIPQLTVEGDEIKVDGVPWQAVNTATRVQVVVQLCVLRAGKLRFLLLDDAEHLDADTWATLKAALVEAGFQIVAAFVQSGAPLTVTTEAA